MNDSIRIRSRGYLPHWERDGATYFITFGTADSLPSLVIERMRSERDSILQTASQFRRTLTASEECHLDQLKAVDRYLDIGHGACVLRRADNARIVTSALQYFDGQRYELLAWCVMPNHVHVVMRVLPRFELSQVLHSWKSFSAKKINAVLRATGEFWRHEYYDHLVRNDADLDRVMDYVAQNPLQAGLRNWPHVWSDPDRSLAGGTPAVP